MTSTLVQIEEKAPAYFRLLQTTLFTEMMYLLIDPNLMSGLTLQSRTAAPETVPVQTYDYKSLDAFALAEKEGGEAEVDSASSTGPQAAADANGSSTENGEDALKENADRPRSWYVFFCYRFPVFLFPSADYQCAPMFWLIFESSVCFS